MMNIGTELRWILVVCGTVLLVAIYWWGRRGGRREREPLLQQGEAQFTAAPDDLPADNPPDAHEDHFSETITVDEMPWPSSGHDELPEVRLHDEQSSQRLRREPVVSDEPQVEQGEDASTDFQDAPAVSDEASFQAPAEAAAAPMLSHPAHAPGEPVAQRKIVALRLAVENNAMRGEQLLGLLNGAKLAHGKFGIFHRMEANAAVFSVASMVEPGSFDLASMEQSQYPGVTLFILLPGPLDALIAFDQMLNFGRRLEHATGGVLQDEKGRPLTAQVLARIRDELMDFQHLHGGLS